MDGLPLREGQRPRPDPAPRANLYDLLQQSGIQCGKNRVNLASESNRGKPGNARRTNTGVLIATTRAVAAPHRFEPCAIAAVGALMKRNAANRNWQSVSFAAASNAGR